MAEHLEMSPLQLTVHAYGQLYMQAEHVGVGTVRLQAVLVLGVLVRDAAEQAGTGLQGLMSRYSHASRLRLPQQACRPAALLLQKPGTLAASQMQRSGGECRCSQTLSTLEGSPRLVKRPSHGDPVPFPAGPWCR